MRATRHVGGPSQPTVEEARAGWIRPAGWLHPPRRGDHMAGQPANWQRGLAGIRRRVFCGESCSGDWRRCPLAGVSTWHFHLGLLLPCRQGQSRAMGRFQYNVASPVISRPTKATNMERIAATCRKTLHLKPPRPPRPAPSDSPLCVQSLVSITLLRRKSCHHGCRERLCDRGYRRHWR